MLAMYFGKSVGLQFREKNPVARFFSVTPTLHNCDFKNPFFQIVMSYYSSTNTLKIKIHYRSVLIWLKIKLCSATCNMY